MEWFRNRYGTSGIEIAPVAGGESVAIRYSKDRDDGPMLVVESDDWTEFVAGVKAGHFDQI
jgi:hypothetical protein